MELKRTFDILTNLQTLCPEKEDMLANKENGQWIKHSVKEYIEMANLTSFGLMALGLEVTVEKTSFEATVQRCEGTSALSSVRPGGDFPALLSGGANQALRLSPVRPALRRESV